MQSDFLVIGGGVIGLNIARCLRRVFPRATVTLLEKEDACGLHASGRNSGVLHAGFYYSPDSLKAKFTWRGNRALTEYCEAKKIPVNRCGKLVVAKDRQDHEGLDDLLRRGRANGIPLEELSEEDAKRIEPRVRTHERALFSPSTATVDPVLVMREMKADAVAEGVDVQCGVRYLGRANGRVKTMSGNFSAGYVVNAAGLFADRVAKDFGFAERYQILPFKGLYLYSSEPVGAIHTNIYPVPNLKQPFLGVHVTVGAHGKIKIGPTALPGLWREHYGGWSNFNLGESLEIARLGIGLLAGSDGQYRSLASHEFRKASRGKMVELAGQLVAGLDASQYQTWGPTGIRAQLVDRTTRKLEMDFVLEGDDRSMHVLNAVSPAFTCSIPFAEYVTDRIRSAIH